LKYPEKKLHTDNIIIISPR